MSGYRADRRSPYAAPDAAALIGTGLSRGTLYITGAPMLLTSLNSLVLRPVDRAFSALRAYLLSDITSSPLSLSHVPDSETETRYFSRLVLLLVLTDARVNGLQSRVL